VALKILKSNIQVCENAAPAGNPDLFGCGGGKKARFCCAIDKESAEIACKQLKRSHFECMALKD
jgi:hypothetical protein